MVEPESDRKKGISEESIDFLVGWALILLFVIFMVSVFAIDQGIWRERSGARDVVK